MTLEIETANALLEAIEKLEAAMHLLSGVREIADDIWSEPQAIRGVIVLVHEGVQHANALLHSILDQGR